MNILFFLRTNITSGVAHGGAESSNILIAEKLQERGHDITFLTLDDSLSINKLKSNKQHGNIRFTLIKQFSKNRVFKKLNKSILKFQLKKLIKSNKTQLIYCNYDLRFIEILLDLKVKVNAGFPKIVMRMAGMKWYEESKKSNEIKRRYEIAFNQIDSVNFISSGLKELVEKKFEELDLNVNFKHSFIGDIGSSFKPGRELPYEIVQDDTFDLVMATRFSSYQKRQDILVEAVKIIAEKIPFHLTLIGSGSERTKIEDYINENGLQNKITVLPFLPQEKLWDLMMRSDLLCHSVEYEGLGKIIIEAMAMGLPVLTSNVTPMSRYINDGDNGFLVENDSKLWAKRIIELHGKYKLRETVSHNSVKFIKENYDPETNITLYEYKMEEIIAL